MAEREGEIFVEEISEKLAHPEVGPPTVDQQKPLQETKLSKGEVACKHGLHSFLSTDPDPDMGSWNDTVYVHTPSVLILDFALWGKPHIWGRSSNVVVMVIASFNFLGIYGFWGNPPRSQKIHGINTNSIKFVKKKDLGLGMCAYYIDTALQFLA